MKKNVSYLVIKSVLLPMQTITMYMYIMLYEIAQKHYTCIQANVIKLIPSTRRKHLIQYRNRLDKNGMFVCYMKAADTLRSEAGKGVYPTEG